MNVSRAQEILKSAEKIDVVCNGQPVWIDSIDAESRTAVVHAEANPEDVKTVPVDELQEV